MMKRILLYVTGCDQLDLVYPLISENADVEYGIFVRGMYKDDFLRTPSGWLPNVRFVEETSFCIAEMSQYGLFISTDVRGFTNDILLFSLLQIFTSLDVPIVEMQSALLSESANLSVSSHSLRWYDSKSDDETCVGYPPSVSRFSEIQGEYVLVLTDFENSGYSDKDIAVFCHAIFEYVRLNPAVSIIWKTTDSMQERTKESIMNHRHFYRKEYDRIAFTEDQLILKRISIVELICKAKSVVTTATMSRLLDCELYHKPTVIYEDESSIWKHLPLCGFTRFHSAEGLTAAFSDVLCVPIWQSRVLPYDNASYRNFLERFYLKTPRKEKHEYINALVSISSAWDNIKKQSENINKKTSIVSDVQYLRLKNKKRLQAIRKLVWGLGVMSLIIVILIVLLLLK